MGVLMAKRAASEIDEIVIAAPHAADDAAAVDTGAARRYILLSLGAAVVTIGMKVAAYLMTGSVGLLSDAAETVINLVAAGVAFWMLTVASRPPDEEHAYGHTKAEYFSSGVESSLILVAAAAIAWAAWGRLWDPQRLENVGAGLAITLLATAINGGVAFVLLRAGRRLRSITLTADGHHLLADVWTSSGVVLGVVLVTLTGWLVLDPIIALLVAVNVTWTGFRLLNDSAHGLLDTALPQTDQDIINKVIAPYQQDGIQFHARRTRAAGQRRFISMHVLVPGTWTVHRGHELCEQIERDIIAQLPKSTVFTHLESLDDPRSWEDQGLDRVSLDAAGVGGRKAAPSEPVARSPRT
jgi:cation diffusion facilitator family transporter